MRSPGSKSSRPDQMEVYLEQIANVVGSDYSVSMSKAVVTSEDIPESFFHAGDCFQKIYQRIVTAESSDPADLRRKIDTVTSVDKGLQKLTGLDDAAAQPILESIKASMVVLREHYPDILLDVENCLDSGLKTKLE